ncbi:MAG: hypothetical protein ACOX9C_01985 [Kiritimatiellia bacterium]|jgi:hypothetical protein
MEIQSGFERYRRIYRDYEDGLYLKPGGGAAQISFSGEGLAGRKLRLFVAGDADMHYQWKRESERPWQFHTIADSLNARHAERDHHCLDLSSEVPCPWVRRAYKKILWPPLLSFTPLKPTPTKWKAGFFAKTENVSVGSNGYLRMRVEVRSTQGGAGRRSVGVEPVHTAMIDIPAGSRGMREYSAELDISPEDTGNVCVLVEGRDYSGKVYVERPFLFGGGHNVLPAFSVPVSHNDKFDWAGQNLSRKEWPRFEVRMNGVEVFCGDVLEGCHVAAEWEIDLPGELLRDANTLEIRNVSDYFDPLPYIVREAGVVSEPVAPLLVVACSRVGNTCEGVRVLLKTAADNMTVRFRSDDGKLSGADDLHFAEAGLHGVVLSAAAPCENAGFVFSCGGTEARGIVPRIAAKEPDGVVTGTGDLMYARACPAKFEDFLCWYFSNNIGNMLMMRPVYRWSGVRHVDPRLWRGLCRVLNELGVQYANIIDGRELHGLPTNPEPALLAGPGYLGRQAHEVDGTLIYWAAWKPSIRPKDVYSEQLDDMQQFAWKDDPVHVSTIRSSPSRYHCIGDDVHWCKRPFTKRDLRHAANRTVDDMRAMCADVSRHTGSTFAFKYFAQAGLQWLGAQTMYGNTEVLMAFLRGARRHAGHERCGVHLATQWSSTPFGDPGHIRRFRLELFSTYILGADEINTEEGLWHLGELYEHHTRFDDACRGLLQQQSDFFDVVSSNSRTGEFHTPMGILHGRYDGADGFDKSQLPFGIADSAMPEITNSWGLLDVVYPLYRFGSSIYRFPCPPDKPQGWHSGTPLGNVDVVPMESGIDLLSSYRSFAFLAYNCAEPEDVDKLRAFVKGGGSLLLCLPHLAQTTDVDELRKNRFDYRDDLWLFNGEAPRFEDKAVGGKPLPMAVNLRVPDDVELASDDGAPLVCAYRFGKGRLTVVNANAYPANPVVRPLYERLLRAEMSAAVANEPVWASAGDDVEFAVYRQPDGATHVYFLAVDWYNASEAPRMATLRIGDCEEAVGVPFGELVKRVVPPMEGLQ